MGGRKEGRQEGGQEGSEEGKEEKKRIKCGFLTPEPQNVILFESIVFKRRQV